MDKLMFRRQKLIITYAVNKSVITPLTILSNFNQHQFVHYT